MFKAVIMLFISLSIIPASLIGMVWGWGLTAENWGWICFSYVWIVFTSIMQAMTKE